MSRRGKPGRSRTLGTRIVAIASFKRDYYEDIDGDDFADYQAQQVVLIAAISVLVGLVVAGPAIGFIGVVVVGARWWVLSKMIAVKGVELFSERADEYTRKRMMRIVGYSTGPLFFTLIFPIPIIGPIGWVLLNAWSLAALGMGTRVILGDLSLREMAPILAVGGVPQLLLLIGAIIVGVWG